MEREKREEKEEKAMPAVKSETYTKSEIAADHPRIGDPGIKNKKTWARAAQNYTRICTLEDPPNAF